MVSEASRQILRDFDMATRDPDLVMVGASRGVFDLLGPAPVVDVFELAEIPGAVLVFYYDRPKDNVRVLGMDPAGTEWIMANQGKGDWSALRPWIEREE